MSDRSPVQTVPPDPWPPPWARKIGFFFGLALATYETTFHGGQNLVVYVFAFVFTGLPLARGAQSFFDFLGGIVGRGK